MMPGSRPSNCLSHFPRSQTTHSNGLSSWISREVLPEFRSLLLSCSCGKKWSYNFPFTGASWHLSSRPGQAMLGHKVWSSPTPSKALYPLSLVFPFKNTLWLTMAMMLYLSWHFGNRRFVSPYRTHTMLWLVGGYLFQCSPIWDRLMVSTVCDS